MEDYGPPDRFAAMDPRRKDRNGKPSDVPPRLIYRDASDRSGRQDNDPPVIETRSRPRIDVVIRTVRERKSRGS